MNVDNQGLGEFDARVSCNVELARAMEYDTLRCGALHFLIALPLRSTLAMEMNRKTYDVARNELLYIFEQSKSGLLSVKTQLGQQG